MALSDAIINIAVNGSGRAANALLNIAIAAEAAEKKFNSFSKAASSWNDNNARRKLDRMSKGMSAVNKVAQMNLGIWKKLGSALMGFLKTFAKFSFLALAAEIAVFTASIASVNLLLATGRLVAQGYQASLRGVANASLAVVVGLSTAAAAVRQFQQASLTPFLGGGAAGYAAAQRANRLSPAVAGLLGGEGTGNVVASLVRGGVAPERVSRVATTLSDLSGGNTEATVGLAGALASKDFEKSKMAVEEAAGFRKDSLEGVKNLEQLISVLAAGTVVSQEFAGSTDMLANTVIGSLKTQFAEIKQIFADLGGPFLQPFRDALMGISNTFKEAMLSISSVMMTDEAQSIFPTFERLTEALINFFSSNLVNNVQNINDVVDRFVSFMGSAKEAYLSFVDALKSLSPASTVVIDMFRAIGDAAGGRGLFRGFADLIVKNKDAFKQFGSSIGNVIGSVFDLLKSGNSGFFGKLGNISKALDAVAVSLMPALGQVMEAVTPIFERLPGIIEKLASLIQSMAPLIYDVVDLFARAIDQALWVVNKLDNVFVPFINVIVNVFKPVASLLTFALLAFAAAAKIDRIFNTNLVTAPAGGGKSALGKGLGRVGGFIGKNAMPIMGAALTGYGIYDTFANQSMGGLGSGLMTGTGAAMVASRFAPAAKMLPISGIAGGAGLGAASIIAGGMSTYKSGGATPMGSLAMLGGAAAGGALVGGSIGSLGGPAAVPGAIIGAVVGLLLGGITLAITHITGSNKRKALSQEFSNALLHIVTNLEDDAITTMQEFQARTEFSSDLKDLIKKGDDKDAFASFMDKYADLFPEMGSQVETLQKALSEGIISIDSITERLEKDIAGRAQTYSDSLNTIMYSMDMTQEQAERFADELGINLFRSFGNVRTAALALNSTLNQIDLNRGVIPETTGLPFFAEDQRANVDALLNTLLSGDISEQSVGAYLSAGATFASLYTGASPLVASLDPILNLMEVGSRSGLTEGQRGAGAELASVGGQLFERALVDIEAATNGVISADQVREAFTSGSFFDVRLGKTRDFTADPTRSRDAAGAMAVQGYVEQRDFMEEVLSLRSNLSASERIKALGNMGFDISTLRAPSQGATEESLQRAINDFLLYSGEGMDEEIGLSIEQRDLLREIKTTLLLQRTIVINGVEYTVNTPDPIERNGPSRGGGFGFGVQ